MSKGISSRRVLVEYSVSRYAMIYADIWFWW